MQVRRAQRDLQLALARQPTAAEVAAAAGLQEGELLRLCSAFARYPTRLAAGAEREEAGEVYPEDVCMPDSEVRGLPLIRPPNSVCKYIAAHSVAPPLLCMPLSCLAPPCPSCLPQRPTRAALPAS